MKNLKTLKKVIEKLNSPSVFDEGTADEWECESPFHFVLDGNKLYDEYENYHIDYGYEMAELAKQSAEEFRLLAEEFGLDADKHAEEVYVEDDSVGTQLLAAVRKDLGNEAYIEWENNVVMIIAE